MPIVYKKLIALLVMFVIAIKRVNLCHLVIQAHNVRQIFVKLKDKAKTIVGIVVTIQIVKLTINVLAVIVCFQIVH